MVHEPGRQRQDQDSRTRCLVSSWSPNGKKIAFVSPRADESANTPDIYVMNPDGTGQERVTNTVAYGPEYQPSPFTKSS